MAEPRMVDANTLLTDEEHEAIELSGKLANKLGKIIGNDGPRQGDIEEMVDKIHQIQAMILAQAGARAFPDRYRTLGGTINA